ncbi:MAG: alpha-glucan family phosphorylase [Cytophagaceae bacterium]|jgi:starch phosphorylase|nr:alpha-glucan family phosphorylase [Cytophagaceae bacterium]
MNLFPFEIHSEYQTKVAYFSMEFAIHQSLKIYSGGLGFLAGSHMHSAYDLRQHLVGVGMLWKYGYYDQTQQEDQTLAVSYTIKKYSFLKDTGIKVQVEVFGKSITVKAYLLEAETFKSAPIILLSTDVPENDYLSQSITHHLYDPNEHTRIAQSIVLGVGGAKILEALQYNTDIFHINEAHALPVAYHLYEQLGSWERVRHHLVFTTHTPEKAGNESHSIDLLKYASFFQHAHWDEAIQKGVVENGMFDYTLAALRMAKKANAVSKIHGDVSRGMWSSYEGICSIDHITNAQHKGFWTDSELLQAYEKHDLESFKKRKRELKQLLFEEVANQEGDWFSPDVLTVVWARRFAGYKRPDLLLRQFERFLHLVNRSEQPIQVIWAGKPYPKDQGAIDLFNHIKRMTKELPRVAILMGYELQLSRLLKQGADVWLNNPRFTREASGTSGMTAAMNGTINLSNSDGWIYEFEHKNENMFLMPHAAPELPVQEMDDLDAEYLYQTLENEVIPTYYHHPEKWHSMVFAGMKDVMEGFNSNRMANEYYVKLYHAAI